MMSMISSMSLLMMSWAGLIRLRTMLEYDLFIFISISFHPTLRKINSDGLDQQEVNSGIIVRFMVKKDCAIVKISIHF
jgi:hypothetical protein